MDKTEYYKVSIENKVPKRCPILNFCERRAWTIYLYSYAKNGNNPGNVYDFLVGEGDLTPEFKSKAVKLQGEAPMVMQNDTFFSFNKTCPEVMLFDDSHRPIGFDKVACVKGDWDKFYEKDKHRHTEFQHFTDCAEYSYYTFSQNLGSKKKITKHKKKMEEEITIFISHGGSHLWKDVARFIEKELDCDTVVLQERPNKGRTVIEKLEEETEDCDFAIIVMTAEDEQHDGSLRARQNVIHEIGFCQGVFGRDRVLVLKQKGVEGFANISGIVYEEFIGDNVKSTFHKVRQEIEVLEEELGEEE